MTVTVVPPASHVVSDTELLYPLTVKVHPLPTAHVTTADCPWLTIIPLLEVPLQVTCSGVVDEVVVVLKVALNAPFLKSMVALYMILLVIPSRIFSSAFVIATLPMFFIDIWKPVVLSCFMLTLYCGVPPTAKPKPMKLAMKYTAIARLAATTNAITMGMLIPPPLVNLLFFFILFVFVFLHVFTSCL